MPFPTYPVAIMCKGEGEGVNGEGVNGNGEGNGEGNGGEGKGVNGNGVSGDPPIGILKNPRLVSGVCRELRDVVRGHCERGELVLTVGGDHSLVSSSLLVFVCFVYCVYVGGV